MNLDIHKIIVRIMQESLKKGDTVSKDTFISTLPGHSGFLNDISVTPVY